MDDNDWRPAANPFGGAPLLQWRTDRDGNNMTQPIGVDASDFGQADTIALRIAEAMFNGASLKEAQAAYTAFNPPTTVVQTAKGPVALATLDAGQQAAYAKYDQERAALAAAAMTVLQTGHWNLTKSNGSGILQPPPMTPDQAPPPATPVITPTTAKEVQKIDLTPGGVNNEVLRVAPPLVVPSISSGLTNTANSKSDAPTPTVPTNATSVTSGSVTAADLGAQTTATESKFGGMSTGAAIATGAAILVALVLLFAIPGSAGGAS